MATTKEVAEWMRDYILKHNALTQREAVEEIERRFGNEFIYTNKNGHPAIAASVLTQFRKLKGDEIMWNTKRRYWHWEKHWRR